MIIELNTNLVHNLFNGTYESMWEVSECNDDGEELEVDYNFKDLMISIIEEYKSQKTYVLSEMNIAWVKSIKFLDTYYSPREYNFSTDTLDFTLEINEAEMLECLKSLKNSKKFASFLYDNYTSYDGFMSFTPNNYNELSEQIKTHGENFEQCIGALISYLIPEPSDYYDSIEGYVCESWKSNGYQGLDYTTSE